MKHCCWQVIFTSLALWYTTLGNASELPRIDEIPQPEHSTPGTESFGTIINKANVPINEVVDFDPVIEMPPEDSTLEQLEIAYQQKLDSRQYPDAVTIAGRMVDLSRIQHGIDSIEFAYAQSDLGAALHHAGNNAEAIEPLRRALKLMKDIRGLFHPDLTGTYAYLGMALQGVGEHKKAIEEMTRAQHLTHRETGAENLQQMSMVYAKANSMEALGELWETEQLYRAAVKIYRHNFGHNSVEILPSLYRLAEWLVDFREYKPALTTYREALQSLQDESGVDTPEMVPAMRGMAVTYLLQPQDDVENPAKLNVRLHKALTDRPDSTPALRGRVRTFLPHQRAEADRGLRLIRRVVAITEQHPQRFSLFERIRAHLELGDWLLLFHRQEQAWDQYAKAWELTGLIQESAIDWKQYFAQPKLIYAGPALYLDSLGFHLVGKEQWNEFDFQIEPDGRPSHVTITDSNMHPLTRKRSTEFLRLGRFRPALDEGRPIVTEHFQIRRNYPTDAPDEYGVVSMGENS